MNRTHAPQADTRNPLRAAARAPADRIDAGPNERSLGIWRWS